MTLEEAAEGRQRLEAFIRETGVVPAENVAPVMPEAHAQPTTAAVLNSLSEVSCHSMHALVFFLSQVYRPPPDLGSCIAWPVTLM